MNFTFVVRTPVGEKQFSVEPSTTLYFLGANGGGKTRLAVDIEQKLDSRAHRISAHRAMVLNPLVDKVSERIALTLLHSGKDERRHTGLTRDYHRWDKKPAVTLLQDYNFLIQALFANQGRITLQTHENVSSGTGRVIEPTAFEILKTIWSRVLPHRTLYIG